MKHNRFKTSLLHLAIQRAIIAVSLVSSSTILSQTVFANTVIQTAQSYHIKAGSLAQAVNQFAEQAGILLNYDARMVEGKQSQGLNGTYTLAQGFNALLSTHGLQTQQTPNGYVLTEKPKLSSNASTEQTTSDAIQLPVINVIADSEKTEKTGRYAASIGTTALPFKASLRETPQSISILTSQFIEDKKIGNLIDVIENTTGLSLNRYESNRGSLFARGFNINNYLIDGTPTSIDEQWSAGEIFNSTALYDRVEILRGSDGLMTGVGNPSAVINMVRKKADSKELTGSLSMEGGSWSHLGSTADISTPLNQSATTRARFVVDYDTSQGYVDALENTQSIFYGTLEQDIGDRTLLSAGISHQDNETNSPTWGGVAAWALEIDYSQYKFIPTRLNFNRNKTTSPNWAYWNSDYTNWFVKAEHDFGNGWNAHASYTHGNRNSESKLALYYPYPINPETGIAIYPLAYAGIYYVDNKKDDINLQIDGEFRLFNRTHELALGYNHSKEQLIADGQPGSLAESNIPNIYEWNGNMPEPAYIARQNYKEHKITQEAFFLSTRISLLEPLKLISGARLLNYEVNDIKTTNNSFKTDRKVVPYIGLVWNVLPNISTYASYTSIFEPQKKFDSDGKLLDPIEGNTYEIGAKGQFFDNRLNANLALFRMEQDNIAISTGKRNPDTRDFIYTTTKGTVSKGFDFEITGEILPQWHIITGYSQFKAKTASNNDVNSLIPRKQFNLFTTYQLPGTWQGLTVGGGLRWQSEIYTLPALAQAMGLPKLEQKAYTVADIMVRYKFNSAWSAQLNINNVFDKKYFAPTEDAMQVYWQSPRNALLSFKYQF